jgi:hypothetical protein
MRYVEVTLIAIFEGEWQDLKGGWRKSQRGALEFVLVPRMTTSR